MTLEFLNNYIDSKIDENEKEIVFKFYDLRVKLNFSEEEINIILELSKIRLENLGYKVYLTGESFSYNNLERKVQNNELLVAVKE